MCYRNETSRSEEQRWLCERNARWTDAAETGERKSGSRQTGGFVRRQRQRRRRGCASQSARRRHRGTTVAVLPLPPHAPARPAPIGPWPLRRRRRSSPPPATHPAHPAAARERPGRAHVPTAPASELPQHPRASAASTSLAASRRRRARSLPVRSAWRRVRTATRARSPPRRVTRGSGGFLGRRCGIRTLDEVGLRASDAGVEEAPRPAMVPNSHCGDNTASSIEPDVPPAPHPKLLSVGRMAAPPLGSCMHTGVPIPQHRMDVVSGFVCTGARCPCPVVHPRCALLAPPQRQINTCAVCLPGSSAACVVAHRSHHVCDVPHCGCLVLTAASQGQ